jgi:YbgC/YbaW family acyl-CoA thioester hydrolase
MTLHLRILQSMARGIQMPAITGANVNEPFTQPFRVLPTDIDSYRHMNNAKYLNYMEAVRWGFMSHTGLFRIALRKKWITPISKIEINFLRPLKVFQQFEVSVQLVKAEERWFYFYQQFTSRGKSVAKALVKSTVRDSKGNVPPTEYMQACGYSVDQIKTPETLAKWLDAFSSQTADRGSV